MYINDEGNKDNYDEDNNNGMEYNLSNALLTKTVHYGDDEDVFIIDTGCKQANICKDSHLLLDAKQYDRASVRGITGHSLESTHVGTFPIGGKTFCIPDADANLLSLKMILQQYIGSKFSGDINTYTKCI